MSWAEKDGRSCQKLGRRSGRPAAQNVFSVIKELEYQKMASVGWMSHHGALPRPRPAAMADGTPSMEVSDDECAYSTPVSPPRENPERVEAASTRSNVKRRFQRDWQKSDAKVVPMREIRPPAPAIPAASGLQVDAVVGPESPIKPTKKKRKQAGPAGPCVLCGQAGAGVTLATVTLTAKILAAAKTFKESCSSCATPTVLARKTGATTVADRVGTCGQVPVHKGKIGAVLLVPLH